MFRKHLSLKNKTPWGKFKGLITWTCAICFSFLLLGIIVGIGTVIVLSVNLPSAEEMKKISFSESTTILDRTGKVLYTIHGEENRKVVPLSEISPHLIKTTIAIEDQHFYEHYGFYPKRMIGSVYYYLKAKLTGGRAVMAGASTITQQFAKNAFLTSEQSMIRKLKELILAIRLERYYTKNEILEMYLNEIPYGNNAYGVESAAQIYFNKHAKDLTLAESAILAGLPQAPSKYNPRGQRRYSLVTKEFSDEELDKRKITKESDLKYNEKDPSEREYVIGLIGHVNILNDKYKIYLKGRADIVLKETYDAGKITQEEKQKAWEDTQKIEFYKFKEKIEAPHFVLYVKSLLEEKYDKEKVEQGGLKVYTTLDLDIQKIAEKVIAEKADFNLKQYGANNEALLAVQPKTGEILAMVGSADYYNEDIDGNVNMVTRPRQPGSAFKPIVYSLAFLKKYSPATPIYDLETKFDGGKPPKNFDGRFEGPISLRRALGQSRNIPAIKLYFLDGGQKEIIPYASKLGIKSLNPNFDYGWPLAIGSGEITLMELTQAYAVFANNGTKKDITPILKIVDAKGKILEEKKDDVNKQEVLNPQVAFLINSILSDKNVRLGPKMDIEGYTNAAKTGTSTKRINKDEIMPNNLLAVNYTPKIVVSIWSGNTDGSVTKYNGDGYNTSAPLAKEFMTQLFKERPKDFAPEEFEVPEGISKITVSKASGKLPGKLTPTDMLVTDYFANFAKPTEIDNSFEEASVDITTNEIATPFCPPETVQKKIFRKHQDIDPTYERWQQSVIAWANTNKEWSNQLPQNKCHLHNESTFKERPNIKILSPLANDSVETGFLPVKIIAPAKHGIDKVEYYLNGKLQYTAKDAPYHGAIRIPKTTKTGAEIKITAIVYDTLAYRSSTEITIFIKQSNSTEPDATGAVNETEESAIETKLLEKELSRGTSEESDKDLPAYTETPPPPEPSIEIGP